MSSVSPCVTERLARPAAAASHGGSTARSVGPTLRATFKVSFIEFILFVERSSTSYCLHQEPCGIMAKRPAEQEDDRGLRKESQKRQRTMPPEQVEEIFSARQLQDLLAFRQDDIDRLRNGENALK